MWCPPSSLGGASSVCVRSWVWGAGVGSVLLRGARLFYTTTPHQHVNYITLPLYICNCMLLTQLHIITYVIVTAPTIPTPRVHFLSRGSDPAIETDRETIRRSRNRDNPGLCADKRSLCLRECDHRTTDSARHNRPHLRITCPHELPPCP